MSELVSSLNDVRRLLQLGEPLDHAILGELLSMVPTHAPSMSQSDLRALNEAVSALIAVVEEQKAAIAEQLSDIHQGRTGIDGYNHLQALHKAQRLSKRA